jgi:enamine deaminase RidA (YjgF/YER057c/UK114 family)
LKSLFAETWHIYRVIARLLEAAGSSMSRVAHQYVLLRDVSHHAMVERVANVVYRGKLPATTVVGTVNIGAYPGLLLEIFCVALLN